MFLFRVVRHLLLKNVVQGPVASPSLGNLLGMQVLGPYSKPIASESPGIYGLANSLIIYIHTHISKPLKNIQK